MTQVVENNHAPVSALVHAGCGPEKLGQNQSGFSLIELAIVMIVVGTVAAMGFEFADGYLDEQRRSSTHVKLDTIEQALVLYVAQNRRLPCPADGADGTRGSDAGVEQRAASGACETHDADPQDRGVVPWKTLGLSADTVLDGWDNFIFYRVGDQDAGTDCPGTTAPSPTTAPTGDGGMDLTGCDPRQKDEVPDRLAGVGLPVATDPTPTSSDQWLANPTESNGAAYVLISHGPNGYGAMTTGGHMRSTSDASEKEKANAQQEDIPSGSDAYVDALDDILRFATVAQVAIQAKLGPR